MFKKIGKQIKSFISNNIEEKSVVLGLNDELAKLLLISESNGGGTAASAISLYEQSTAVSVPVNFISECFSSIIPVVEVNGEIDPNHEALEILNKPSPFFTRELLFETLSKYFLITGESYIVALGNINRIPLEIQPISPSNADVPEGLNGYPSGIRVSGTTLVGVYKPIIKQKNVRYISGNLREIKQIRNFSPKNNSLLRGQSPLQQASAEVRQHIYGNKHNISILKKGGRVSLIFHFDQNMSPKDFEETKARVREQYGGYESAGEIGVTAGGKLDIKEAGTTNRDMDFANLQQIAKIAIALQYRFPLPLLTVDAATMNNYKESKLALYDDAVLPLADKIFSGLTDLIMPRLGLDPAKVKFSYDLDSVTALASRRIDELLKRKNLDIESDNELRALIGRESYEGGDIILKPANLVPVGTDLFTNDNEPSTTLARDEDENG